MTQEQIEQAAREIINYNLVDLGDLTSERDLHRMLVEMANKVLSHQWISVEEALPEADGHGYSQKVLVRQKFNPDDIVVATYNYNAKKWNHISPITIHDLQVTHWMPIPPLSEGGEK